MHDVPEVDLLDSNVQAINQRHFEDIGRPASTNPGCRWVAPQAVVEMREAICTSAARCMACMRSIIQTAGTSFE